MNKSPWEASFLRLNRKAVLKRLEIPYLYHIGRDELYEIDDKAEEFLSSCNGTVKGFELTSDAEFVEFCVDEGLIDTLPEQELKKVKVTKSPTPSLRYLELQLTDRCNLRCRHCYLGDAGSCDMPLDSAVNIAREFSHMAGLRLLISGGEPMLYPSLSEFIKETSDLDLRRVILTNGTMAKKDILTIKELEEAQFSLDGWSKGHEILRGPGTFEKVIEGIRTAREYGLSISIATMVHSGNLDEFDQISKFVEEVEAVEWGIDAMCISGTLKDNRELTVSPETAAEFMKYAYGGSYHGSSGEYACGRHLLTVLPGGDAVKCGFYDDNPLGDARQGLLECWLKLEHIKLEELECRGCKVINDCAGGCRFRAPNALAPDPYMCSLYGINREK